MYYIQVGSTGYVCKGSFIIHGEPYKTVGNIEDAREFKTFEAAYNALERMAERYANIDYTCQVVHKRRCEI